MAISAEVSSRNRFSVLVIAVIYPSVLEKEQTPRKIKVSPITITKQQHETILAILGELKIGKFSIKIIIIGRRLLQEDIGVSYSPILAYLTTKNVKYFTYQRNCVPSKYCYNIDCMTYPANT